jgi:DNA helicase-2/ATP-dependent DNA helicase PcrA
MEEGLFPAESARFSGKEVEEERRLFYVAVTRAKRYCFLSYAKTRFKWGQFQYCVESIFLKNIPNRFFTPVEKSVSGYKTSPHLNPRVSTLSSPNSSSTLHPTKLQRIPTSPSSPNNVRDTSGSLHYSVGDRVEHERFGCGTVLSLEGTGNSAKAVVDFQGVGSKTLLLSFARLKKLMP